MKAMYMKIYGRVQGVWFRASTQEQAIRLGLAGWVRNTPDGAVEIQAQGSDEALESLFTWCHHGPPGADVDRVESYDISPVEDFKRFIIR